MSQLSGICDIQWSDEDVVNADNYEWSDKVWVFHDHGFILGVVLENTLQDAMDELADSGKIKSFCVDDDITENNIPNHYQCLGNDCSFYDTESICFSVISKPAFSLRRLCN